MNVESVAFSGVYDLRPEEVRVLGCLLEKQRTTPEMYPLTLNALRLACNQSTSRDPVVEYDDGEIRDALHRLERRGYARLASGQGSRAPKYRHLLAEALPMGLDEQAVMCVLMLRGPQTPGELKQRVGRMHTFASIDPVHETLERLIARGLAARLERRPGQKEERYAHLLGDSAGAGSDDTEPTFPSGETSASRTAPPELDRLPEWARALAERISSLERELADLRQARWPAPIGEDLDRVRS
jgi:uncharacterized protein YceH (UPF0502 family)